MDANTIKDEWNDPTAQKVWRAILTIIAMHGILASIPPQADYNARATLDQAEDHARVAMERLNRLFH